MEESALQIGLLGCGMIAQFAHLPALLRARGVQLAAVCDASEELCRAVIQKAGINKFCTRYDDLLNNEKVQAILIAVPDPLHVSLAARALHAGKHVLVEKPLGTNVAECEELIHLVEETKLTLQVGSMKRHDPGVRFAQEFLKHRAGRIHSVSGVYRDSLFRQDMQDSCLDPPIISHHAVKPTSDPKSDRQHYNLFTQGAHLFDNLRFLAGEINAVTAQLSRHAGQFSWHGLLEFVSGGIGHFELTCKSCGDWHEEYTVLAEHGSVEVNVPLPFYNRPSQARTFDGRTQQWNQPLGGRSNAYANQLEAFANAILKHQAPSPSVYDGLAVVRLLEAVEQSTAAGTRVEVPCDKAAQCV